MPSRIGFAFAEFHRQMLLMPHGSEEFYAIEMDELCFDGFCDEIESVLSRPGMRQDTGVVVTNGISFVPRTFIKYNGVRIYRGPAIPYPPIVQPKPDVVPVVMLKQARKAPDGPKPKKPKPKAASQPEVEPPKAGQRRVLRRRTA
jgi:hypothetical protein